AVERPARRDARIGADIARVADDLVDVEELSGHRNDKLRGVVGEGHEALERAPSGGAQLEPIGRAESELHEACAEVIPPPTVFGEVAARMERAHEAVGTAARETERVPDLGNGQTARLRREELEDVEGAACRLDRKRLPKRLPRHGIAPVDSQT